MNWLSQANVDARQIAAEDQVLREAPFSLRAIEIRHQRGLPQPAAIQGGAMMPGPLQSH